MGAPPAALLRRLVPGPRDRAFFFFGMPLPGLAFGLPLGVCYWWPARLGQAWLRQAGAGQVRWGLDLATSAHKG